MRWWYKMEGRMIQYGEMGTKSPKTTLRRKHKHLAQKRTPVTGSARPLTRFGSAQPTAKKAAQATVRGSTVGIRSGKADRKH